MNSYCKHCNDTGRLFFDINGETISHDEFKNLSAQGEYAGEENCPECYESEEEYSSYDPDQYHDTRH